MSAARRRRRRGRRGRPWPLEAGARHVVDRHGVDAAEGGEVEPLDVVHVHADAGHVAEEHGAPAVGGQAHDLGDTGAVEVERVGAALALDDVAAVARVPAEAVGAGAQDAGVVAAVAVDGVVPAAAVERLDAVAAVDGVVAARREDRERLVGDRAVDLVDTEAVVTREQDLDRVERRAVDAVVGGAVVAEVDLEGVLASPAARRKASDSPALVPVMVSSPSVTVADVLAALAGLAVMRPTGRGAAIAPAARPR